MSKPTNLLSTQTLFCIVFLVTSSVLFSTSFNNQPLVSLTELHIMGDYETSKLEAEEFNGMLTLASIC